MTGSLFLLPAPIAPYSPEVWSPENIALCVPVKAIQAYASLDSFIVESERSALRLLSRFRSREKMDALKIRVLDEHSRDSELPELFEDMKNGMDCGFLSEAGMPCVADPGAAFVAYAREHGAKIVPVSGPSSILLALAASGLDAQRFYFLGYLPQEGEARRRLLARISEAAVKDGITRLFIETPYRNKVLQEDLLSTLPDSLWLCVAAGLDSLEERIVSKPVAEWKLKKVDPPGKLPAVFLIGKKASIKPPNSR